MRKIYDVAVIGSGLIGVTAAYELAKSGQKVALLDAGGLSKGASSANTGLLLFEGASDNTAMELCRDSLTEYRNLNETLGVDTMFQKLNLIIFMQEEKERKEAKALSDTYKSHGFVSDIIDNETIRELEPGFCLEKVNGALYLEQWQMDPMKVVYGYFKRFREYGGDWYPYTPAVDFIYEDHRILGVKTPSDTIYAGQFVVAAGAWSRELMAKVGFDLHEYYINGAAMVAERGGCELRHGVYPFANPRIRDEQAAGRMAMEVGWENVTPIDAMEPALIPDVHGTLLVAERIHIGPEMMGAMPASYLRDMAASVLEYFPGFSGSRIIRSWITPVPFVPGGQPFFGFVKPFDNLFISSGYVSVLVMAPVLGAMTKRMLLGENPGYDVREYDPMRFER